MTQRNNLFDGIQSFCGALGRWSCYIFCILKIAEEYTGRTYDPIKEIIAAIDKKYVKYNWDNAEDPDNMYVQNPEKWLHDLTGGHRWSVRKEYSKPSGDYLVEVWNNAHFRLPDWDPLQNSVSVAKGKITSWRVLTPSWER